MNRRIASALGALALALLAAGCGPGSGGTGDGENIVLAQFGATGAPVCGSGIAGALDCPPATGSPTTPVTQGTMMVFYSDTASGNNVAVRIQGNTLELAARCQGLAFDGQWGIAAQNDARFFGTYTAPGAPTPTLASLTVAAAGSQELFVQLRDAQGRVLLGPVLLRRVPAPVANPAACPS